jgi:predicted TIM-barrel fold metal-dependent hydrolase
MLSPDLPHYNDSEGDCLPPGISCAIDAHVHVFPDRTFQAVRNWFDAHAWQIRYRDASENLIQFLLDRGVAHVVALQYAHKPGIARDLNAYMAGLCRMFEGRMTGLATVFPGETGAADILTRAFDQGLGGVKLHVHVQCFDLDSPDMDEICAVCSDHGKPMVVHASREPKSDHYRCDPHELCRAGKVASVLTRFPDLKFCVPHLGFDEVSEYSSLMATHENLWLDTAMVLTDYFPASARPDLRAFPLDRVMYGSDFPNIPYAWDRELKWLAGAGLCSSELAQVAWKNAARFFNLDFDDPLSY